MALFNEQKNRMNKVLVLLAAINLLWSCNSKQTSEMKGPENLTDTAAQHHEDGVGELSLNNGAKWKADAATTNNVNNLKTAIFNFKNANDTSLAGYQNAGNDLQNGLDKMISECRMKGPDHDALHKWLMPLLKQVKEYKLSSTTTGSAEMLEGISNQVNNYYQYFE